MPFHHVERVGKATWFGIEKADAGTPAGAEIQLCPVVIAATKTLIDDFVGSAVAIENIAERGELFRRQHFCKNDHVGAPANVKTVSDQIAIFRTDHDRGKRRMVRGIGPSLGFKRKPVVGAVDRAKMSGKSAAIHGAAIVELQAWLGGRYVERYSFSAL